MDDATADQLRRYSRGEMTSRAVRDATGLDYALVLGGLSELGLRPPRARLDGPNGPALKRSYDLLLSVLVRNHDGSESSEALVADLHEDG